ncbi:hypothetical protein GCM10010912_21820 [Paenibacillus albidus]|uniref:Uncharacterized protein n=1 Tax=Paenibacillus albidus TaxID=2041023 RepID=A0A917FEM9_9BACL|nr:hypothetical protein GCM10010912_21820 [Paenibacillus albidus]
MAHSKATFREACYKPRAEIARVHFIHQDGQKEARFRISVYLVQQEPQHSPKSAL